MRGERRFLLLALHLLECLGVAAAELAKGGGVEVQLVLVRAKPLGGHCLELGNLVFERMQLRVDFAPQQLAALGSETVQIPSEFSRDKRHVAELPPERFYHRLDLLAPLRRFRRRGVVFALMPEDAFEHTVLQRDPRPGHGVRPEVATLNPAVDSRAADCARDEADLDVLVLVRHRSGETGGEPRARGLFVEMYRFVRDLPFSLGVKLEYPVRVHAVGGGQDAAPRHVGLPHEEVDIHVVRKRRDYFAHRLAEVRFRARERGLERFERLCLERETLRLRAFRELRRAVAGRNGLRKTVRHLPRVRRVPMPRQLVLVAAAIRARGVLEKRFFKSRILDLLYRVETLVRFPDGVVGVEREEVGHRVAEVGDVVCADNKPILQLYACRRTVLPPFGEVAAKFHPAKRNQAVERHAREVDRVAADELVVPGRIRQQREHGAGILDGLLPFAYPLLARLGVKTISDDKAPVVAAPGAEV